MKKMKTAMITMAMAAAMTTGVSAAPVTTLRGQGQWGKLNCTSNSTSGNLGSFNSSDLKSLCEKLGKDNCIIIGGGNLSGLPGFNCPETDKPEIDKPETDKPEIDKPETDKPETDKPDTDKPETDKPEIDKPETDKPETDKPEIDKPEIDKPETDKPETDKPEIDKPEIDKPETDKPEIEEPNEDTSNNELAAQVIELVNEERSKAGLSPLSYDKSIEDAAMVRAKEIKSNFSHTRPDGTSCFTAMKEAGVKYSMSGENIAYGQRNAKEVMKSWMNSQGHRENILKASFGRIGVGVYEDARGTLHWVQMFAN